MSIELLIIIKKTPTWKVWGCSYGPPLANGLDKNTHEIRKG